MEEVGGGEEPGGVQGAGAIDVDAAGFDVLAGLALAGAETGGDEGVGQGDAGGEVCGGGDGSLDFGFEDAEGAIGEPVERGAEEDFGGAHGIGAGGFAVDERGDLAGEGAVGGAAAWIGEVFLFEGGDFVRREEREEFEVADDIAVVGLNPELVELVDAGAARVEPDGAALGFTEFGAVGFGDEREG